MPFFRFTKTTGAAGLRLTLDVLQNDPGNKLTYVLGPSTGWLEYKIQGSQLIVSNMVAQPQGERIGTALLYCACLVAQAKNCTRIVAQSARGHVVGSSSPAPTPTPSFDGKGATPSPLLASRAKDLEMPFLAGQQAAGWEGSVQQIVQLCDQQLQGFWQFQRFFLESPAALEGRDSKGG